MHYSIIRSPHPDHKASSKAVEIEDHIVQDRDRSGSMMKMVIVLAVCLALSAASASALQLPWMGMGMGLQAGFSPLMATTMMMGAGAVSPCAEYLRQPQCSPVAAPLYALREQSMWQPSFICQPLRQHCCMQLRMMDMQSRCQAMCSVAQSVVQQLQMTTMMQLQQPALMQQQWQQLLPAAQAITPLAMVVAQVAQNLPAMCGLYQLPSYCTTPCALSAAIPPYF